jgi:pimeloyl-ACP methyl ester carboxylesterase
MSLHKEIKEDFKSFWEGYFRGSKDRFEFQGINGPIVAVHGVGGIWSRNGLRNYMTRKHVSGVLVNFGSLTDGIDNYVDQLSSEISRFPNPLLLGFSAGGFVALRYAQKYGWDKISKIITIATPFNGTRYANLLANRGQTFQDVSLGSNLLTQISNMNIPSNRVMSLFAQEDIYTKSHQIKLPWETVVLNAKSHGEIQNEIRHLENILNCELALL